MEVRVFGSRGNIQSSVDFYLQLTDVGKKTISELRSGYFSGFLAEEVERRERYLEVARGRLEENVDREEEGIDVDEKEAVTGELDRVEEISEEAGIVEETSSKEFHGSGLDFLSAVNSLERTPRGIERVEYETTGHGRYVDEEVVKERKVEVEGFEYVGHGRYVEEEVEEVSEKHGEDVEENRVKEISSDVEYVSHGCWVEEEYPYSSSSLEDTEKVQVEGSQSEEVEGDFEWEDDPEEVEEESEEAEDEFEWDSDEPEESLENVEEQDEFEWEDEPEVEEPSKDGISVDYEDEDISEMFDEEGPAGYVEDIEQVDNTPVKPKVTEVPKFKSEVSLEDEGSGSVDVPKDLREFIRQHPCSTVEYVSKFYPRKEIEKQISLGRVYKKKGKLMI